MSKKSSPGLFAFITGLAAGAAAIFLSKKENRQMAKKEFVKAEKKVQSVAKEVKKDPKKFAKKVQSQGNKLAKKVVTNVSTQVKKSAAKKSSRTKSK